MMTMMTGKLRFITVRISKTGLNPAATSYLLPNNQAKTKLREKFVQEKMHVGEN